MKNEPDISVIVPIYNVEDIWLSAWIPLITKQRKTLRLLWLMTIHRIPVVK